MEKIAVPWQIVNGFGGHIKATATTLVVQKKGAVREYPLSEITHLLVCGGHNIHTSAITQLLKNNASVSFFDADGRPLSVLRPFGFRQDEAVRSLQMKAPEYTRASEIVRSSIKSRMMLIDKVSETAGRNLYYEGEREFLYNLLDDVEYLITMEELRRIQKLSADMYYETISRSTNPVFGFRRRTPRPHKDPINSMLSLGYSMLFGNCCVSIIGADLDGDIGVLREGSMSLVQDLIDPLKAKMVDSAVFKIAAEILKEDSYDIGTKRCHLNDEIMDALTDELHGSINQNDIDRCVLSYRDSIAENQPFKINY